MKISGSRYSFHADEEREDRDDREDRPRHRDEDAHEVAPVARAVDARRLVELHRKRADVVGRHERAERDRERRQRHDDRRVGVQQAERLDHIEQRHDQRDRRQRHPGEDEDHRDPRPTRAQGGDRVRRGDRADQHEQNCRHRDDEAVEEELQERRRRDHDLVVRGALALQRDQHDHGERRGQQHDGDDHEDLADDPAGKLLILEHGYLASRVERRTCRTLKTRATATSVTERAAPYPAWNCWMTCL